MMIAQMLDKLVANAVEFSAAGTPIVVRLERGDTELRLSVENEGPLLPDAMRGRLFDSMVSVRGDQVSDAPHLGLGLYIVRLIAKAHHGSATAQNRDDGRGVVVSVTLPYAAMG
jgi:two-component system, OmpR family, sensor histidine kinase ChvG